MITGRVSGDSAMLLQIKSRGIVIRDALRTAVHEQGIRVLALVKLKVSGTVLKNRTGTLRRKLNVLFREGPNEILASIGLKLAYAAAHEYGFDGTVSVKEHLRRVTMVYGRPLAEPVMATVRAHEAHMQLPERSYLRSTLREETPSIRAALATAMQQSFT
jgi:phage gpG-like protein